MIDLNKLAVFRLARGRHKSPEQGLCFLEAVAWMAGEPHSDHPQCVCPVIGAYGRRLNDRLPDDMRQALVPLIDAAIGTRAPEIEEGRRHHIALRTAREIVPLALEAAATRQPKRAARLRAAAARLAALPDDATLAQIRDTAAAADAAAAAYAAYAADTFAADAAAAYAAAAADAAYAYADAYAADAARKKIHTIAIDIFASAIRLGPHGDAARHADTRIAAYKALVAA